MTISSDYSTAFDTILREYICNKLEVMEFPDKAVNIIKSLYKGAVWKILMNFVDINEFCIDSGFSKGYSLCFTLFDIGMMPLLI